MSHFWQLYWGEFGMIGMARVRLNILDVIIIFASGCEWMSSVPFIIHDYFKEASRQCWLLLTSSTYMIQLSNQTNWAAHAFSAYTIFLRNTRGSTRAIIYENAWLDSHGQPRHFHRANVATLYTTHVTLQSFKIGLRDIIKSYFN